MATKADKVNAWKLAPYFYFALGVAAVAYLYALQRAGSVTSGSANDATHLIISLTVALPEFAICYIAARGAVRFKQYALGIREAEDGKGLDYMANALLWMVIYIALLMIAGSLVALSAHTSFLHTAVNIANHLPLAIAIIAAATFFVGAKRLNSIVPLKISEQHAQVLWIIAGILGLLYIGYFHHFVPTIPAENGVPRFALPVDTLIVTYVVPNIVLWGLGIYACMSLANYSLRVKGAIYRSLFKNLSRGIMLVFLCTFLAQLLIASNLSLEKFSFLLVLTYGLLLLGVYGFTLIYQGAENLHKIENI